jgi:opacity protein-like surface antigen
VHSVGLRVTDNSSNSYPTGSETDLTDTDNTFVVVADCIEADLAVTASSDQTQVIIPDQVTVTATVSNGGPDDASFVRLVANVDEIVEFVSITPDQGSCAATGIQVGSLVQYECDIGDLAAGDSMDIVVVINADQEGSATFEFTVDVDGGQLLQLSDPDLSNNSVSAIVSLIDEIIVVVKGKGAGSIGWFEILALFGIAGGLLLARRRRARATMLSVMLAATLTFGLASGNRAVAAEHLKEGFYVGGALGAASSSIGAAEFEAGMTAAGYNISDVSFGDDTLGWKVTAGYMFNENVGVQASYVDLGELDVQYTASVPPDEIESMLATGASILPGRGRGFLMDLIVQYPFSERVAGYATLGAFFAEPESTQTVISGGSGSVMRQDDDTDFAGSIGLSFAVGEHSALRVAYEHYEIDGEGIDFPTASFSYGFGGGN